MEDVSDQLKIIFLLPMSPAMSDLGSEYAWILLVGSELRLTQERSQLVRMYQLAMNGI